LFQILSLFDETKVNHFTIRVKCFSIFIFNPAKNTKKQVENKEARRAARRANPLNKI